MRALMPLEQGGDPHQTEKDAPQPQPEAACGLLTRKAAPPSDLDIVHLGPVDQIKADRIYHQLHAFGFRQRVISLHIVGETEAVLETGATTALDRQRIAGLPCFCAMKATFAALSR